MARSPEIAHLNKAATIASRLVKHETPDVTETAQEEAETQERSPEAE